MAFDEQISNAINRAVTTLRGEINRGMGKFGQELFAALRAVMQAQIDDVRAAARAQDPSHLDMSAILDEVRAIDRAQSLSQVLDILAQVAGREAPRAAMLLASGNTFRGWYASGFGATDADVKTVVVAGEAAGIIGTIAPGDDFRPSTVAEPNLPAFARGAGRRFAVALPIVVDSRTVAVLYADAPADGGLAAARWPGVLEILARHTSSVLEGLTVRQANATIAG